LLSHFHLDEEWKSRCQRQNGRKPTAKMAADAFRECLPSLLQRCGSSRYPPLSALTASSLAVDMDSVADSNSLTTANPTTESVFSVEQPMPSTRSNGGWTEMVSSHHSMDRISPIEHDQVFSAQIPPRIESEHSWPSNRSLPRYHPYHRHDALSQRSQGLDLPPQLKPIPFPSFQPELDGIVHGVRGFTEYPHDQIANGNEAVDAMSFPFAAQSTAFSAPNPFSMEMVMTEAPMERAQSIPNMMPLDAMPSMFSSEPLPFWDDHRH